MSKTLMTMAEFNSTLCISCKVEVDITTDNTVVQVLPKDRSIDTPIRVLMVACDPVFNYVASSDNCVLLNELKEGESSKQTLGLLVFIAKDVGISKVEQLDFVLRNLED